MEVRTSVGCIVCNFDEVRVIYINLVVISIELEFKISKD